MEGKSCLDTEFGCQLAGTERTGYATREPPLSGEGNGVSAGSGVGLARGGKWRARLNRVG